MQTDKMKVLLYGHFSIKLLQDGINHSVFFHRKYNPRQNNNFALQEELLEERVLGGEWKVSKWR